MQEIIQKDTTIEIKFTPEWIGKKNGKKIYGCTIKEDEGLILYEIYDKTRNNEIVNDFIQIGKDCGLSVVNIKEVKEVGILQGNITVIDKVSGHKILLRLSEVDKT